MRLFAVVLALGLLGAACGDDDDSEPTGDPTAHVGDRAGGDDSSGAPTSDLRGVEVCEALLPAFDGDVDDLSDYATESVLSELSDGYPGIEPDAVFESGPDACGYSIGDGELVLRLFDDPAGAGQYAIEAEYQIVGDNAIGDEPIDDVDDADDPDDGAGGDLEAAVRTLRSDRDCTDELSATWSDPIDLPEGTFTMVLVPCELFAYQAASIVATWDGAVLTPFEVGEWVGGDDLFATSDTLVGLTSIAENGTITNFQKYRGLGDCGHQQVLYLPGQLTYRTLEVREQTCEESEARDEPVADPDEWPVVYTDGE